MQQDQNHSERAPLTYELIVKGNKDASVQQGEPHLVFRRKPLADPAPNDAWQDTLNESEQTMNSTLPHVEPTHEPNEEALDEVLVTTISVAKTGSTDEIAKYIASLTHHVPDDVSRVVDAIIAEESRLPKGLPTLDESMAAIYSNPDEAPLPLDEEFGMDAEADAPSEPPADMTDSSNDKSLSYTKKVEYEDR